MVKGVVTLLRSDIFGPFLTDSGKERKLRVFL